MRKLGREPKFLPLDDAENAFFQMLMDMGPIRDRPLGGFRPVDWPELAAFSQAVGPLERWEVQLLRELSIAYADEMIFAENPLAMPPVDREDA